MGEPAQGVTVGGAVDSTVAVAVETYTDLVVVAQAGLILPLRILP
jgi:hypothetical protein